MKRLIIAMAALALAGCDINAERLGAGTAILSGVAAATIAEVNGAGIDPIQLGPEKLAKYAAGCNLAVAGAGLFTGDVLTTQGARLCELVQMALAAAPVDPAGELTPIPVEKPKGT